MTDYAALIDDEEAPKNPGNANPYASVIDAEESNAQTRRQQNVLKSVDANAEQYALAREIEKHLQIPAPVAERNLPDAQRKYRISQMDHVLRNNPAYARAMENEDFAKLSADHAQQAADILNGAGTLKEVKRSRLEQMGDAVRGGFAQARQNVTIMARELGLYNGADAEFATRVAEQERVKQRFNAAPDVQAGLERISKAETMGDALMAILEEPLAVLDTTVRSIGASSPSLLLAAGGSIFGPAGTAGGAGLGSFAVEFSNTIGDVLQERGVDFRDPYALAQAFNDKDVMAAAREKAAKRGIAIGVFDAATAGVAGRLLAGAKPTVRSIAPRVSGEFGIQAAGGMAGEASAQALTGEYKPGEILMEGFAELPTGIVEVRSNWRHARDNAMRTLVEDYSKANTATKTEGVLNGVIDAAAAAPITQRGPEVLADAINDAMSEGVEVEQVYVSARQLATVFNQDPVKAAETLGIDPKELDQALASNGDIGVRVGDFVAAVAADEAMRPLVEHVRMGVGEMSAAEAREWESKQGDAFKAEAEKVLAKREQETAFSQSAQQVEDFVLGELQRTGRFTESVNKSDAALHKAFAVAMADRLGMLPMEFFQKHVLRVQGASVAGDQFDQTDYTPDDLLALFSGAPTINIEAKDAPGIPRMSEEEANAAEFRFLSTRPAGETRYTRKSGLLKRVRRSSEAISDELGGSAETPRSGQSTLAGFSAYEVEAEIIPPDEFYNPGGTLKVRVFGKEQLEAGLTEEPALTFTVTADGELSVNGPNPDGATFKEFNARGWADLAKGAGGEIAQGWSVIRDPKNPGANLPISQTMPLLADVHARVREWRGQDMVGLHWSRSTGAIGGMFSPLDAEHGSNAFFQSGINQTDTPEFKRWSNGNKLVTLDESHSEFFKADEPVVVQALHGTTGDFTIFDQSKANPESDMGGGFYFTNTPEDVSNNYAGEGPDLTQKIQLTAERIASETDREYDDPDVVAEAKAQLSVQHGGMAMPVWVRFDNPVVLGGNKETQFTYSYPYDEATDEYGEETGTLVDFIVALRNAAGQYNDGSVDEAIDALLQKAQDYEQISASELVQTLKDVEEFAYYTDDNGNVVRDEIIRQAFEGAGFDGIIDQTVADKFGVNRRIGQKMLDVGDSTVHFIAFAPEQIKSSIGNNGQFDPNNPDILAQPSDTGNRGSFNPDTNTIALLQNADLSTFLHESGHYFLEVMASVASQPDAPASVRQDFETLLQWFNVPATPEMSAFDTWSMMSLEEKRQYHEQFARGFEAYLMEGKAPSVELQSLFSRFRAWLINVYKSLAQLNVELTDEVRGVMDRMVATDEQIATAEAARRFAPIFQTPDVAGMTADEWDAYQSEHQNATDTAAAELESRSIRDMRWLSNAKSKRMKELQRTAKALRAEVEMGVRAEVMSQPVYQAWQFLTGKPTKSKPAPKVDPKELNPTTDSLFAAIAKLGGIDKLEIVQTWGTDPADIKAMPRPVFGMPVVRTNDGRSIDDLAQRLGEYGYLSTDENGKVDVRDLEDAFASEMRGNPVYSVQKDYAADLAPAQHFDLENYPHGKLDRAAVALLYGKDHVIVQHLDALKMLTSRDGYDPDFVADQFGFSSGDEMMRTLAAADTPKDAIEGMTDQRMLENYGDLSSPEAVERAAEKAIHNDVRARFLTRELNSLRKATGKANVLLKAARQHAEARIASLKVRDAVKSAPHRAAEARSGKAAEEAFKGGDLEVAAIHKRDQLLNHELARAALAAQDEVQSAVAYFKKFDRAATRKALAGGYLDQIDQLLERFDFRKATLRDVEKRASLAKWLAEQEALGLDPVVDSRLVEEAQRQHYTTLTMEELRGLIDTVKSIEHLGRLKNKLLTSKAKRDLNAAAEDVSASIIDNANREVKGVNRITPLEKGAGLLKGFSAMHRKFASIAREMDGNKDGGAVWEYFVRTMNDAGDREVAMRGAMSEKFADVFAGLKGINLRQKVAIPELNTSLRREEMLAIALNSGNSGNVQRLLDGGINDQLRGLSAPQLMNVLNKLSDAEWDFVEGVWAMIEANRPAIAAQEKALTGVEPKWIEPEPFTLESGRVIRGGYYPAKYNADFSTRSNELEAITDLREQMRGASGRASTRNSYAKERAESVTGRPLRLDLGVIAQHINEVTHRLAWQQWIIDARRLLAHPSVDRAVRDHYGSEILGEMKKQLADIAAGDNGPTDALDKVMNHIRNGTTIAGMGWNIMTSLMQPIGLTQSVQRVGFGWIGKGLAQFVAAPFERTAEIHERSSFMHDRAKTINREINDVLNRIRDERMSKVEASYFYLIQKFQQMVDVPTWLGAYEKAIAEGNAEARAVALADQAVLDSQGGGQLKDLPRVQRGSAGQKLFTNFYSFFNTTYNLAVESGRATDFSNPLQVGKLVANYLLLFTLPAVWGFALKEALRGDDDEDDFEKIAKRLAVEQVNYLLGTMVLAREIGSAVTGFNGYQGPAGTRFFSEVGKLVKQTGQGDVDMALVKAAANTVGIAAHLPSGQVMKSVEGTVAVMDGKAGPHAVLVGPPLKN